MLNSKGVRTISCSRGKDCVCGCAGPPAASLSGQNATMRVLSLDARPSPGWTPGEAHHSDYP